MKLIPIMISSLTFLNTTLLADANNDHSCQRILESWESERIYYKPASPNQNEWNGIFYSHAEKKCFLVTETSREKKILCPQKEIPCKPELLASANLPYYKEPSFPKFLNRFKSCHTRKDRECLKSMISKTAQLSFGFDGYGDRREQMADNLLGQDYTVLKKILENEKFESGSHNSKHFGDTNGTGHRGEFKFSDGAWRLTYFLAGD